MTQRPFPQTLLHQSASNRLTYFQGITVPHQHLKQALDDLLLNIHDPAGISVIFVFGPAGVGKTTLRLRAEKVLMEALLPQLYNNPNLIPVAAVEAMPPEKGYFSYKDFYIRVVESLNNVLFTSRSSNYPQAAQNTELALPLGLQRGSSAALRRYIEKELRYRQVMALMIDEAQHLLMIAGGQQMLHQMNWIKSIANITGTIHVLIGTYDLLNCCTLSGQISRRSYDIHLSRYLPESREDVAEFIRVIQSFQQHLPLEKEPTLVQQYEYLLDYSIGCVGILKTWLIKALRTALFEGSQTLTLQHLRQSEYSLARRKQIQAEAELGEKRFKDAAESESRKRINSSNVVQSPEGSRAKRRVGQRQPRRDEVGVIRHGD